MTKECRSLQKKQKTATCILLEVRGGRWGEEKNAWKTYLHDFIAEDHQKSSSWAEIVMIGETLGRARMVLSNCFQRVLLVSSTVLLQEKASLPRSPCFSVPFL